LKLVFHTVLAISWSPAVTSDMMPVHSVESQGAVNCQD